MTEATRAPNSSATASAFSGSYTTVITAPSFLSYILPIQHQSILCQQHHNSTTIVLLLFLFLLFYGSFRRPLAILFWIIEKKIIEGNTTITDAAIISPQSVFPGPFNERKPPQQSSYFVSLIKINA